MGRLKVSTCILGMVLVFTLLSAPVAQAYACDTDGGFPYRASDDAYGVLNAEGVTSRIISPDAADVSSTNPDTAGDIYVYYGNDFVQVGWYIGSATGLPYASSPRVFYGEHIPGTAHDEVLRPGSIIGWGSNFKFTVKAGAGPVYYFYLDGVKVAETLYSHALNMRPGSIGETNLACERMYHRATSGGSPIVPSIFYTTNGTSWSQITDSYNIQTRNGVDFFSGRAGAAATHFAYGGGS